MQNNTNLKNPHCSRNSIQKMTIDEPSALGDFNIMKPYENLSPEDLPGETWKDIPGYESLHQVSNLARFKSFHRKGINKNKLLLEVGKVMKQKISTYGYPTISLTKDGRQRSFGSHVLLMLTFKGPANGRQIDHINEIKTDNRIENLEYVSCRENIVRYVKNHKKSNLPLGVTRQRDKFQVKMTIDGIERWLGVFLTLEEAVQFYEKCNSDIEFAKSNIKVARKSEFGYGIRFKKGKYEVYLMKTYLGRFDFIEDAITKRDIFLDGLQVSKAG